MRPVILDKSYLQAASHSRFLELSEQYQFLMPDVLFYELISCDEPVRSTCFSKLPQKANPIPLVKSLGELLREELTTRKPAGLPSKNLLEVEYQFNPGLGEGSYNLPDDLKTVIFESEAELDGDVNRLMDFTALERMFPHIHTGTDEERKEYKSEYERYIAENPRKLGTFLSSLEPPDGFALPTQEKLNESWTLLRWLQVRLLFNLDLYVRYGNNKSIELTKNLKSKLKNDVLDMNYLILGVLQHGFATKERKLIEFYNLLCPGGLLLTE